MNISLGSSKFLIHSSELLPARRTFAAAMQGLHRHIESIIFCAPEPVGMGDLLSCLKKLHGQTVPEGLVLMAIDELQERYKVGPYPFEIVALAGGYRFLTKPECKEAVSVMLAEQARKKLSASALETLAIVAYRQPITKAEVEAIRGVSCDYALLKLLERGLVAIGGRKEAPGRPVLYETTTRFLEHVGIHALADLPPVREHTAVHELGEVSETEVALADITTVAEELELIPDFEDSDTPAVASDREDEQRPVA